MDQKRFSKFLLGGASAPILAAMAARASFCAIPGHLFAAPDRTDGSFMGQVGPSGSTTLRINLKNGSNKNFVQITVNDVMKEFRRNQASNALNNDPAGATIAKCYPLSGSANGPFNCADIQAILAFYNAN